MDQKHYLGHRKRLKEKFLRQKDALLDYELLELALGYALPRKDTKLLAKDLLAKFGSIKGVINAKNYELKEVSGIGDGIILFLEVLKEIFTRIQKEKILTKKSISSPKDVVDYMSLKIGFSSKESFWILLMDNRNRIIKDEELLKGTVDEAYVYLREIFSIILKYDASKLIIVHNHPGGDPTPSEADKILTNAISEVSQKLNIRLLDHIIVAEDKYFSFKENNLL